MKQPFKKAAIGAAVALLPASAFAQSVTTGHYDGFVDAIQAEAPLVTAAIIAALVVSLNLHMLVSWGKKIIGAAK